MVSNPLPKVSTHLATLPRWLFVADDLGFSACPPFKYPCRFSSENLSMAYRSVVLGITGQCSPRNSSKAATSRFPTSRSIQPTALWIRSSLSPSSFSAIPNVSAKSP